MDVKWDCISIKGISKQKRGMGKVTTVDCIYGDVISGSLTHGNKNENSL